jgi:hypothetical protein
MEAVRTSETSVDNYFTRQYIPEDNSEQSCVMFVFDTAVNARVLLRLTSTLLTQPLACSNEKDSVTATLRKTVSNGTKSFRFRLIPLRLFVILS